MIRRLDHVYYWVSDMDRAVKFYQNVVGLRLARREGGSWAMFDASSDVRLALHGAVEGRPIETGGATAVFRVDDLDSARSDLERKGARFDEHMGEVEGYARFASFFDPDGNRVQIIEYVHVNPGVQGVQGGSSPAEQSGADQAASVPLPEGRSRRERREGSE
jgi:predicted enzyme related to lactoylglutathione lyase